MPQRYSAPVLDRLIDAIARLRTAALDLERERVADLGLVPEPYRDSARNLLHYLALRRHDLRALQFELSSLGLSSLGRSEADVLAGLDAVLLALHALRGRDWSLPAAPRAPAGPSAGPSALDRHAERLLGPAPPARGVRIMVTMPTAAADDPELVASLVEAGMDVARINAAHDDRRVWEAIARNVRLAEQRAGRQCRVLFDLGGPKLRTCSLGDGPRVVTIKPIRDARGRVVERATVRLAPIGTAAPASAVPVPGEPVLAARVGDRIVVVDAAGKKRKLVVVGRSEGTVLAETPRSVRFETGCPLRLLRDGETLVDSEVGPLPSLEASVRVLPGDTIRLTGSGSAPAVPERSRDGSLRAPLVVPCTLDGAWSSLRSGERIRIDDGRIAGVVEEVFDDGLRVRVEQVPPGGARLRGDKGINLPDSELAIDCPTRQDLEDLDFAVAHADMVGMSFVQRPADLVRLEDELTARDAQHLGIVLKIETKRAFRNLPQLLLTGLRSPPVGVMVARGDLAVEVGFARLAEVQEEILWLCEAAHVPVIWATQVLESLAKSGLPSRAEVSDAAMGVKAECVMLNKGPFVVDAVRMLGDVLQRMRTHHAKKRALLRELHVSWLGEPRG